MDNTLIKLVNPEIKFEFAGKEYTIRKATLDKAVQYQQKIKSLEGDETADAKLISFCVYIMLKEKDPELTEDFVMNNIPADVNYLELLTQLGFINPSNSMMVKKMQEALVEEKLNGKESLQS